MNKHANKIVAFATTASLMTAAIVVPVSVDASTQGIHVQGKTYSFKDVDQKNPHKKSIEQLAQRHIIKGYPDGTFRPYVKVTRAQVATIIAGALNLDTRNIMNPGFSDVRPGDAHYGAIAALVQNGIINGYQDRTFKPLKPLTRGQMAKILVKAYQFKTGATDAGFIDTKSSSYKEFIDTLYALGITTGTDRHHFSPAKEVTRGQLASFIIRCDTRKKDGK